MTSVRRPSVSRLIASAGRIISTGAQSIVNFGHYPNRKGVGNEIQNSGRRGFRFLSDGGEDVRNLQLYLSPEAEHILDWFHLTMRITVLKQTAKGLPIKVGEGDEERELRETALKLIESVKWYLWHGNVFQALEQLESLSMDLESADFESPSETTRKLLQAINEFHSYIERNRAFIPNYGERYRNGERIRTQVCRAHTAPFDSISRHRTTWAQGAVRACNGYRLQRRILRA